MNWHLLPVNTALRELQTSESGLTENEAVKRRVRFGPNELVTANKNRIFKILLNQFSDVMIVVLIAGVVLSLFLKEYADAVIITIILLLDAITGFIQEYRAEEAMKALKQMATPASIILREGLTHKIHSSKLVPGDIVLFEAGTLIPADLRIIENHSLQVNESSLTGESVAVDKISEVLKCADLALGDYRNMAFKGTHVTYGRGKGVVTAIGMETELGKIAGMLVEKEPPTPLQLRMNQFSQRLTYIILFICVILFITGFLRGYSALNMLLLALSVAVAAIPEALPAIITISLSLGSKRLVRNNVLIRKLYAVETLGSVSFICTDKTGTLTRNEMEVREVWVPGNEEHKHSFLKAIHLNHTVQEKRNDLFGDPTEVALVLYLQNQADYDPEWKNQHKRVHEIPFDSERKLMTTIHKDGSSHLIVTKGAVEAIIAICPGLSDDPELTRRIEKMTSKGLRVIAYAYNEIGELPDKLSSATIEKGMKFLGLAGLIDPPREEVKQAIRECKTAGIITVMLTGDHPATAAFIARELGILNSNEGKVITGPDLEAMSQIELEERVENLRVYARVSPAQKLRIIKAIQKKGHFVAMTGDGVNDAPSVKMANIGIAMGITGTDVTKEAAHMILLDDNFTTIVGAIKQGRRIYDNIRKFILYILAGNLAELSSILLAPVLGLPLPLIPVQILWINLVSDGLPALALAAEPAEKNLMNRPPRKADEGVLSGKMGKKILYIGGFLCLVTVASQYIMLNNQVKHWQTIVFCILCFGQLWQVMAIRSETEILVHRGILTNKYMLGAVVLTVFLQLSII
ncbi:MAG TPA: cation-translocating P-type ATPase, partial [Mucilaginibacter sp.]|nr:cation-translocating P-type ATPase [Mucilaginibacter sp.]